MSKSNTIKNEAQSLMVTYVVAALVFSNVKNIIGLCQLAGKGIKKLKKRTIFNNIN